MTVPTIKLNDGRQISQLGFGVFQIEPGDTADKVKAALDLGYRHIDTAQMYGNEEGVGKAVADSGIPRDELWITTKLNNDGHSREAAVRKLDESLTKLGLDHVDLYLIHWPQPKQDRYVETWQGLEDAQKAGKALSIGVSNFQTDHLDRLAKETSTVPAVNQIEFHPRLVQRELREYLQQHDIALEAWSPIGQGKGLLEAPELTEIAQRVGKSAAQVVLRWHIQLGNIVFPKSNNPERIKENFEIFDFALSEDDIAAVEKLHTGKRIGPDPDDFG
ncbi:oxidoreductase of aldo/keto reductase family, subgroup 1 [Pseudonocardia sp. Ae406_Ps2]|uniref:aldo/keto reductase n=1 Tax=unclassified Pseudonocardia TaxID=2619320 RepID=UPI00094AD237|nr:MULTISPECIES: aldo/keto reductase [unclassified Pseudonocardia]OLL97778.1 oxidoreductase of aldo/keto reductase family, subgroup 1 [Pseudonocardia sp. Ae331_Ps2]OLM04507.1 oxidoreductase of aldo/keto reductase family, subgroup 1 [Pseudonocardia sp. Ae406_Ps2]OLM10660.1 oxidoreductase of aldo/keto reductase family, subgroup 1 [Pseudonocardia sp. Ae505_Ps2]OLM26077.1 oxidoreductase of aldo/keto reductase family, subgroup 1 [Pseudonocardia sp. Ae706_Ps2]